MLRIIVDTSNILIISNNLNSDLQKYLLRYIDRTPNQNIWHDNPLVRWPNLGPRIS